MKLGCLRSTLFVFFVRSWKIRSPTSPNSRGFARHEKRPSRATDLASGSHGTDLFQRHPELPATNVDWFVTTPIETPGHASADAVASAAALEERN
jgi:hypothetical protein